MFYLVLFCWLVVIAPVTARLSLFDRPSVWYSTANLFRHVTSSRTDSFNAVCLIITFSSFEPCVPVFEYAPIQHLASDWASNDIHQTLLLVNWPDEATKAACNSHAFLQSRVEQYLEPMLQHYGYPKHWMLLYHGAHLVGAAEDNMDASIGPYVCETKEKDGIAITGAGARIIRTNAVVFRDVLVHVEREPGAYNEVDAGPGFQTFRWTFFVLNLLGFCITLYRFCHYLYRIKFQLRARAWLTNMPILLMLIAIIYYFAALFFLIERAQSTAVTILYILSWACIIFVALFLHVLWGRVAYRSSNIQRYKCAQIIAIAVITLCLLSILLCILSLWSHQVYVYLFRFLPWNFYLIPLLIILEIIIFLSIATGFLKLVQQQNTSKRVFRLLKETSFIYFPGLLACCLFAIAAIIRGTMSFWSITTWFLGLTSAQLGGLIFFGAIVQLPLPASNRSSKIPPFDLLKKLPANGGKPMEAIPMQHLLMAKNQITTSLLSIHKPSGDGTAGVGVGVKGGGGGGGQVFVRLKSSLLDSFTSDSLSFGIVEKNTHYGSINSSSYGSASSSGEIVMERNAVLQVEESQESVIDVARLPYSSYDDDDEAIINRGSVYRVEDSSWIGNEDEVFVASFPLAENLQHEDEEGGRRSIMMRTMTTSVTNTQHESAVVTSIGQGLKRKIAKFLLPFN